MTAGTAARDSPTRLRHTSGQVAGGVAAQFTQASSSLVLQLLAVRLLGLEGLGLFAVVFALIVLGTAINSGFVGDSLTVLAREDRRVRAGLQAWWLSLPLVFGVLLAIAVAAGGFVTGWLLVFVASAATLFMAEDILRRLLMASLCFWRIVIVDLSALVVTAAVLGTVLAVEDLQVGHFFLAMTVGQLTAAVIAAMLLPRNERRWVNFRGADLRSVWAYGSWRALQQSIKPALLAGVRVGGLAVASAAAVGELEAARIYLSPVLIVVGGLSTVMLARYASRRAVSTETLIKSGDRTALRIALAAGMVLMIAVMAHSRLAPLVTGTGVDLSLIALAGWSLYAIATGVAAPYSTLAAVRGRQRTVVLVRLGESLIAGVVVAAIFVRTQDVMWAPAVLGAGSLIGGVWLRVVLLRQARAEA